YQHLLKTVIVIFITNQSGESTCWSWLLLQHSFSLVFWLARWLQDKSHGPFITTLLAAFRSDSHHRSDGLNMPLGPVAI
ncbi:MAG: hypothetical protein ACR2QF_02500, partial [Geminicoccaceae bacterium]